MDTTGTITREEATIAMDEILEAKQLIGSLHELVGKVITVYVPTADYTRPTSHTGEVLRAIKTPRGFWLFDVDGLERLVPDDRILSVDGEVFGPDDLFPMPSAEAEDRMTNSWGVMS